jgi:hypothetical protein
VVKYICFILLNLLFFSGISQDVYESKDYVLIDSLKISDTEDYFFGEALYYMSSDSSAKVEAYIAMGEYTNNYRVYLEDGSVVLIQDWVLYKGRYEVENRIWLIVDGRLRNISSDLIPDNKLEDVKDVVNFLLFSFKITDKQLNGRMAE